MNGISGDLYSYVEIKSCLFTISCCEVVLSTTSHARPTECFGFNSSASTTSTHCKVLAGFYSAPAPQLLVFDVYEV